MILKVLMFRDGSCHLANVLPLKVLFVVGTLDTHIDDISNISMVGYFRQPHERPPTNNMGFQLSTPNALPAGAPIPGDLALNV